jgi:hypothetical protein
MKPGQPIMMVPLLIFLLSILPQFLNAQTYIEVTINQAPVLTASAGPDVSFDVGSSATLGGIPVATGGTGSLTYYWDPPNYLDHADVPNPLATPPGNITYTLMVTDERGCMVTDEIVVTVIGGTGINDYNTEGDLIIFPNPSTGAFTLDILGSQAYDIQISVFTITGLIVHNEILTNPGTKSGTAIDLSSLPRGSYILRIRGDFNEIYRHIILN